MAAPWDLTDEIGTLDDLQHAVAAIEIATARVALSAARLGAGGHWQADGSLSMTSWMRANCRLSHRDAARMLRLGRFLDHYQAIGDAALSGRLPAGHVTAIRSAVSRPTEVVLAEQQTALVDAIAALDVADAEQTCAMWRELAEATVDMPEPAITERSLTSSKAADGTRIGNFVFDPVLATEFEHALGTARSFEGATDERPHRVRNADALFDILAFFNANHTNTGTPRHRPHVELHIGADQLDTLTGPHATTNDATTIPQSSTEAFLCDCVIHRVIRADTAILDVGTATRTVHLELFRAVAARDGGCRHPGCDRKTAWCDAHHIHWWRHGGHTKLDNLILLCARHHHLIHKPGWNLHLQPDNNLTITTPDGRTLTSQPRGQPHIRPPIAA